MCLVQSPYYSHCGHWGAQIIATHGRCARAEHILGACWEPEDIGVTTVDELCAQCKRFSHGYTRPRPVSTNLDAVCGLLGSHDLASAPVAPVAPAGPVDVKKFNKLVCRFQQAWGRRDSVTSISSQGTADLFAAVTNKSPFARTDSAATTLSTLSTNSTNSSNENSSAPTNAIPAQPHFRNPVWDQAAQGDATIFSVAPHQSA